jgi:phosphopantetheinyl transferase
MIYWHWQDAAGQPDLAQGDCPPGLLNAEEREHAQRARLATDKRWRDWLLGRWTAKNLLRSLAAMSQPGLALDAITITTNRRGAPVAHLPGSQPRAISISHSHGRAACAAADGLEALVGIDLDYVEPRSEAFVSDFLTSEEQALAAGLPAAERDLGVMAIWAAKEAVLKALQTGLTVDTRTVSCRPEVGHEDEACWRPVAVAVNAAWLGKPAPRLAGWWRRLDEWVVAVVEEAGGPPPQPVWHAAPWHEGGAAAVGGQGPGRRAGWRGGGVTGEANRVRRSLWRGR